MVRVSGEMGQQQVLEKLDGGLWASLDNTVPLKAAAKEVDIGGHVVQMHQTHRARPAAGQLDGGQFLSDKVRRDPNHLGIYGGMYWGQDTAPKSKSRRARGLVRRGDKWLHAPARGQRGVSGQASDAQVGGIIKALEHQSSPPPPEWWVRKRQEWLEKQRIAAAKKAITKHLIKINPDFTGRPLKARRDARYERGPALSGLRRVKSNTADKSPLPHAHAKAHANARPHAARSSDILILPGKHFVHHNEQDKEGPTRTQTHRAAYTSAAASPRESTVEKALARAEAIRHNADKHLSKHDRAQAEALEHTAASLRSLARAMSGAQFQSNPDKLANIAKQLSLVSESLAGSAEKQAAK